MVKYTVKSCFNFQKAVNFMKSQIRLRHAAAILLSALLLTGCSAIQPVEPVSAPDSAVSITPAKPESSAEDSVKHSAEGSSSERTTEATSAAETETTSAAEKTEQTTSSATTSSSTTAATSASSRTQSSTTSSATASSSATSSSSQSSKSSVTTVSTSQSSSVSTSVTSTTKSGGYTLSADDKTFLKDCVFVGDSICSGLRVYNKQLNGAIPSANIVATGSVAARSIFDYTFSVNGTKMGLINALKTLKPKYVIFSMGMNDVNMTSAAKYCENYKGILTKAQEALPNAKLYVASITPISNGIKFSTNTKIDTFNKTIRDYLAQNYPNWGYVDIAPGLKNSSNGLQSQYSAGDGIHLAPAAYTVILSQVCRQIR